MNTKSRNTSTSRRCPRCEGAGEVMLAKSAFREHDVPVGCAPCQATGWIDTGPYDPMRRLKFLRSFGANFGPYREAVAVAMRPVVLP